MTFFIDGSHAGMTVLCYLREALGISHKSLTALKYREDGITLNGCHVTVRQKLTPGDLLTIADNDTANPDSDMIPPSGILPDIIYEDGNIIAMNKPPYMPTHPSHGHTDDTLANSLATLYASRGIPFIFRPMGRLDRNTSGIVVSAKTQPASSYLFNAMKRGEVHKEYIAVLNGIILPDQCTMIRAGIKRQTESIIMRTVCDAPYGSPEYAETRFSVLAVCREPELTLIKAFPVTGRTHQLRVHFAYIGHSILGDDLYGRSSDLISRHALHAYGLEFPLPFGGEKIRLSASIASDIDGIIKEYFPDAFINQPGTKGINI